MSWDRLQGLLGIVNQSVLWLEKRQDDGAWFRRGYVVMATGLTWQVTLWAMRYAETSTRTSGSDIALIIGAVVAPTGTVAAFAFKQYLESRGPSA